MTEAPLISCLMVSRGHLFPARFAIDCYRRQTYKNRELVIVCEKPGALLDHVEGLADPSIRIIQADPAPLGDLRNVSLAAARGELVAQWDDDDLYHPQRVEFQAKALASRPDAAAHFLSRWYLWWPERRKLARSRRRVWEGSMMARRALLPDYPPLALSEDRKVVNALLGTRTLIESDAPRLYCYIVHGGNSWGEAHFEKLFGRATETYDGPRYDDELAHLAQFLPVRGYDEARAASRR